MQHKQIDVIQVLRGYGALSVFISHFLGDYDNVFHFTGQLGVAVFFLISGFLLIYTTDNMKKDFFIKRLIRIVPLYYFMTLVVALIGLVYPGLLHTSKITLLYILKSLFFIPNRLEGTELIQPILPVGWTLYSEIFVYLIFYLFFRIFSSNVGAGISTAIVLSFLVCINTCLNSNNVFLNIYGGLYILYYVVGILFAICYKKYSVREVKIKNASIWDEICIIGFLVFLIMENYYHISVITVLIISSMFCLIVFLGAKTSFNNCFTFVGKISFSFYLCHYFVIKAFSRLLPFDKNLVVVVILYFMGSLGLTIFASLILNKLFEEKIPKLLKKVIEGKQNG